MRRQPVKPSVAAKLLIVAMAAVLYLVPLPQTWIERHYSESIYPALQRAITSVSNLVPFAVFDLLVVAAAAALIFWWIRTIKRAGKGHRLRALAQMALNTVFFAAVAVLLFLLGWGLNYRRTPLINRLDFDRSRISLQSAHDLSALDVANLNSLVKQAHEEAGVRDGDLASRIAPSFQQVVKELRDSGEVKIGKPKRSLFNGYLSSTGVDGFTDPFSLEVILNSRLLPQEMPFALAHEWSHLAGFADESEANFIALLTCVRSDDPAVRYAGWLALYESLPRQVLERPGDGHEQAAIPDQHGMAGPRGNAASTGRGGIQADGSAGQAEPEKGTKDELTLDPRVIADLAAIQNRVRASLSPWLSAAETKVYDRYLKSNRVAAGVASYGLFIRLVLGTKFAGNWSPVLKGG